MVGKNCCSRSVEHIPVFGMSDVRSERQYHERPAVSTRHLNLSRSQRLRRCQSVYVSTHQNNSQKSCSVELRQDYEIPTATNGFARHHEQRSSIAQLHPYADMTNWKQNLRQKYLFEIKWISFSPSADCKKIRHSHQVCTYLTWRAASHKKLGAGVKDVSRQAVRSDADQSLSSAAPCGVAVDDIAARQSERLGRAVRSSSQSRSSDRFQSGADASMTMVATG